ncbi:hypothetical protein [Enterococcus wangshanyuanii]|uniref:Large polyvalent protein associated domain-containing protein n=1 Tax=Enterococcus wangshanyuanii TaxID=2005703 RepID=A0ABQ1PR98_9ENTE|nr:hypothetical protein [Enterococcus wangshanyuanii]GGD01797.1 hypothetical protein GCM10011573_34140 [Enterococcus wangshanyuanii]
MEKSSTINVQNVQKEWLKKYVEIGKQQLQKSIEAQNYLKRNIFSRISNRQEIRENEEYINSLSGALSGVENQQELYLHKPIELKAPSRLEEPLLRDMVQLINEKYNEKIQGCIENVTLENFEKTYREYRGYELDLSNMNTADYRANQTFPSLTKQLSPDRWEVFILETEYGFDQWEGDFYALPTTKDYPDKYVMAYLENQNLFHETGDIRNSNEAEAIRRTFSYDTLKKINEFVDEGINDYKTKVSRFSPFDFDVNPIFKEIDRLKDYLKIPNQSLVLQENKEKKDRFVAIYDSLPKEEQVYLNTYNDFQRELLSNEYSDTVEGRSYEKRDLLEEQASQLNAEQLEKLKEMYREYISTNVNGAEPDQLHMDSFSGVIEEWKELQVADQDSLVNTLSQLTMNQQEYLEKLYLQVSLKQNISELEEKMRYEIGEKNFYERDQQFEAVEEMDSSIGLIQKAIDSRENLLSETIKTTEQLEKKLKEGEREEVEFIAKNVDNSEYKSAVKALQKQEMEGKELKVTPTVYSLGGTLKMFLQGNEYQKTDNVIEIKDLHISETGQGSGILGKIHNLTQEEAIQTLNFPFSQEFTDKYLSIGDSFSLGDPEPLFEVESFTEALRIIDQSGESLRAHLYEDIIGNFEEAGRTDIVEILKANSLEETNEQLFDKKLENLEQIQEALNTVNESNDQHSDEIDIKKIAEEKARQNLERAETINFEKHNRFLDFYNELTPDEKNFVKALNDKELETYFMHEDFILYETDGTKSEQYEKVAAEFPKERVMELESQYHSTVGSSFNWTDKETTIHDVYSIIGHHPETTFTYQEQVELDPSKFIESEEALHKETKKNVAEEKQQSGSLLFEKEEVIDLYAKFLQGESLTYDERSKIVAYDQKNNSFEQMQYRLEAIDTVHDANPEINLSIQEEALCQTRGEQEQMSVLISAEYYQQSISEKSVQNQEEKERKEQKKEKEMVQQVMM